VDEAVNPTYDYQYNKVEFFVKIINGNKLMMSYNLHANTAIIAIIVLAMALWLLVIPIPVQALSYQPPPIHDELTSPFTETEANGIGCLAVSLGVGSGMVYLLGGVQPIMATLATRLPMWQVIEGSAAIAFVFSSACYIGAVLAPISMATYTAIIDSIATKPKFNKPLFIQPKALKSNANSAAHTSSNTASHQKP